MMINIPSSNALRALQLDFDNIKADSLFNVQHLISKTSHVNQVVNVNDVTIKNKLTMYNDVSIHGGFDTDVKSIRIEGLVETPHFKSTILNADHLEFNSQLNSNMNMIVAGDTIFFDLNVHGSLVLDDKSNILGAHNMLSETIHILKDAFFEDSIFIGGDFNGNDFIAAGNAIFEAPVNVSNRLNTNELEVNDDCELNGSVVVANALETNTAKIGRIVSDTHNVKVKGTLNVKHLHVSQMFESELKKTIVNDVLTINNVFNNKGDVEIIGKDVEIENGNMYLLNAGLSVEFNEKSLSISDNDDGSFAYNRDEAHTDVNIVSLETESETSPRVVLSDNNQSTMHLVWSRDDPVHVNKLKPSRKTSLSENACLTAHQTQTFVPQIPIFAMGMGLFKDTSDDLTTMQISDNTSTPTLNNRFYFQSFDPTNTIMRSFYFDRDTDQFLIDDVNHVKKLTESQVEVENVVKPTLHLPYARMLARPDNPNINGKSLWYSSQSHGLRWGEQPVSLKTDFPSLVTKQFELDLRGMAFLAPGTTPLNPHILFRFLSGVLIMTFTPFGILVEISKQTVFSQFTGSRRWAAGFTSVSIPHGESVIGLENAHRYSGLATLINNSTNVNDVDGWLAIHISPGNNRALSLEFGMLRQGRSNIGNDSMFTVTGCQVKAFTRPMRISERG